MTHETAATPVPWRPPRLPAALRDAYLARLDVDVPAAPSAEALRRLHRAHVERVPYETLWIHLGERRGIDPTESAAVAAGGRGGYCFHLQGAFSALLTTLGYDVRWHLGGVQRRGGPAPGPDGNHLALTVHGLATPECPEGTWYVDVGLGDALLEPLPLRAGEWEQAGLRLRLSPSPRAPGWRLDHDPAGGFEGMDFASATAAPPDFLAQHERLSTAPDSGFVRVVTVQRRHRDGADVLRGCLLTRWRVGRPAEMREVTSYDAWWALLEDDFGLSLSGVGPARRGALWERVVAEHQAWRASLGSPAATG